MAAPVGASELNADAVRGLVSGRTWALENILDSNQTGALEWKKNGTVCLRLGDERGKCDDSGTWKISGAHVCYEVSWWLKSYGMSSICLGVADLGKGRYQARLADGSRVWEFTLAR